MRSSTFYSFVFTASALLVQGVPVGEREIASENIVVTEVRTVTAGDASAQTDAGDNVTSTITAYETFETTEPAAGADVDVQDATESDATQAKNKAAAPEPRAAQGNPHVVYITKTMGSPNPSPAPAAQPKAKAQPAKEPAPDSIPESNSKPSTGGGGGGKRGLSYEPNDVSLLKAFAGSKSSWVYNWGTSTKDGVPSGMEYVPMLWGLDGEKYTNKWPEQAKKAIASGSKHLLSFNEPDHKEQANISPQEAAAGHIKWINPLGTGGVKIGGPAVTNGEAEKGMGPEGFLKPFLEKCGGKCKIDFQPVHWYDSADNMAYFKKFLKEAHDIAKKPLWLTEFAASGSPEQQAKFLGEALPYLDGLDYVERYAYFMVKEGRMITGGAPNAIGKAYL